ncbi:MAG: tRNA glutamyl-Q(34) synthetase GluQRS [Gammaproteobacteria bacterium]
MVLPDKAASQQSSSYRGRFAPSPTGPLHAGSLLAALASYLDARACGGRWLLRIEDLDPPRESHEAAADILRTLELLGLTWDESVVYQSQRTAAYEAALAQLDTHALLYACNCSRLKLSGLSVYPGWCRDHHIVRGSATALRCRVPDTTIAFTDRLQGIFSQQLARDVGDFVVRRRDGLFAYQLAVVIDDAWQGITDIVRGIDLLDSTPRQIYLQQQLGVATPRYAHVPVIVNAEGQKLGKQQFAAPVDATRPADVLYRTLQRLRQEPDPALAQAAPHDILAWAIAHWQPQKLAGIRAIPEIEGASSPAV